MNEVEVKAGDRAIYYSSGYTKRDSDGVFCTVTHVTKTGRIRVSTDNSRSQYKPVGDNKYVKMSNDKHCGFYTPRAKVVLITKDYKDLEERALMRLWKNRLEAVNFEDLNKEQLMALISVLNTQKID